MLMNALLDHTARSLPYVHFRGMARGATLLSLGAAVAAQGALTTYNSEAAFVGVLGGVYLYTNFASVPAGTLGANEYQTYIGEPFIVLNVLTTDGLWASRSPSTYGYGLSAETFNTDLTLDLPTHDVLAFGGWFFLTDQDDNPVSGAITVTTTTATGSTNTTFTTVNTGTPTFLGWTSDEAIWAVTLASNVDAFNTVGNIYAGQVVIPEAGTASLLAATAALGTALAKRRRPKPATA